MRELYILLSIICLVSCKSENKSTTIKPNKPVVLVDSALVVKYANTIKAEALKKQLYIYASDSFNGRRTGDYGQKLAVNFIKSFYQSEGIQSPIQDTVYFQTIPKSYLPETYETTENVLAYIPGKELQEEVVVISAHLDHIGVKHDEIFNGADDDGSGTVAIMQIAKAFKLAQQEGYQPKRSLLFLHVTAEEIGLYGSRYYTENPVFPLQQTVADLNIDMIGRIDKYHTDNPNYLYLIGADRLSTELHDIAEATNTAYTQINLDYKYNDPDDSNRFYYRSDHYNFAKHGIPVIFYFNGTHADYHKPTDTPDKIDYNLLTKRTQLIFATAWQLANQPERITVDSKN